MPPARPLLADYPPSTAVAVLDPDDVLIIDEHADRKCFPASLVKLMTARVALAILDDLDLMLTVGVRDLRRGSGNNLLDGDTLTLQDVLYDLLLPSSNTAAALLARVAGSRLSTTRPVTAFIAAMNYERLRLGLQRTYFTNATGLYSQGTSMISTAHDIARLVRASSQNLAISELWAKKRHTIAVGGAQSRTIDITSTVPEVGRQVVGAKTGTTPTRRTFNVAALLDSGHIASVVGTTKQNRWDILSDAIGCLEPHTTTARTHDAPGPL